MHNPVGCVYDSHTLCKQVQPEHAKLLLTQQGLWGGVGKGGTYWGPWYYWLFTPNLCNTYPCHAQHKLANDPVACNKLFVKTARLLAKQDPDADGLLSAVTRNEE